ncbi:MAG: hypothetical protein CMK32_14190 [Porticoccaceae bacterium]|nr:hypothetical protein [Porticoccaceae bacterium]
MTFLVDIKHAYWQSYRTILRRIDPYPHLNYARKNGYIFVHIPKTAGTSVLNALGIPFRVHADWKVLEASDPVLFRESFKFCFVRNPFDRLVSVYSYLLGGGAGITDAELSELLNASFDTFDKFVSNFLNFHVIHQHPLLRPQYLYVCDLGSRLKVDFVGRYESLDKDFSSIAERLNMPSSLPMLNTSDRKPFSDYYGPETIEKVVSLYLMDFEIFNYPRSIISIGRRE